MQFEATPQGFITYFVLISIGYGFRILLNAKMPTIVNILTCIAMINTGSEEQGKSLLLNILAVEILRAVKLSMSKFYNLWARAQN